MSELERRLVDLAKRREEIEGVHDIYGVTFREAAAALGECHAVLTVSEEALTGLLALARAHGARGVPKTIEVMLRHMRKALARLSPGAAGEGESDAD